MSRRDVARRLTERRNSSNLALAAAKESRNGVLRCGTCDRGLLTPDGFVLWACDPADELETATCVSRSCAEGIRK